MKMKGLDGNMFFEINGTEYIIGQDRNEPNTVAHLYKGTMKDPGNPMCVRGWNRSGGFSYSIFRNSWTSEICEICLRRAEENRDSIPPRKRKTKYI